VVVVTAIDRSNRKQASQVPDSFRQEPGLLAHLLLSSTLLVLPDASPFQMVIFNPLSPDPVARLATLMEAAPTRVVMK
jgi:hypothetical protein